MKNYRPLLLIMIGSLSVFFVFGSVFLAQALTINLSPTLNVSAALTSPMHYNISWNTTYMTMAGSTWRCYGNTVTGVSGWPPPSISTTVTNIGYSGSRAVTITTGTKTFTVTCTNGASTLTKSATVTVAAPINGGWSDYGPCQGDCGQAGVHYRTCTNPAPANGGNNCVGIDVEYCTVPACPVAPNITAVKLNNLTTSQDWPAGIGKNISWQYSNFTSSIYRVSVSICRQDDTAVCATWSNPDSTAASASDIIISGSASTPSGSASTIKTLGPRVYERLDSGDTTINFLFSSNKKAVVKICPVDSAGVKPANAVCKFSPEFTVVAKPSITITAGASVVAGTAPAISWTTTNFPTGSTCSASGDSSYVSGWNGSLSLPNGSKNVNFTSVTGQRTLTANCTVPTGQNFGTSAIIMARRATTPATGAAIINLSVPGIYETNSNTNRWAAGDYKNINWFYWNFDANVKTVSISLCNPLNAGSNSEVCALWNTDPTKGFDKIDSGGGVAVGDQSYNLRIGPLAYTKLIANPPDTALSPYFYNFQSVVRVCPTNSDGTRYGTFANCAYSPLFTIFDYNYSSSFSGPSSGPGCTVNHCVCYNGKPSRCGTPPMQADATCPISACNW